MARKIDPFHAPLPAEPRFASKVRSAAGSMPVFDAAISEPRNVVVGGGMGLEEFVDTGIRMGAAAFYTWGISVADYIPIQPYELEKLGAVYDTVGIINKSSFILGKPISDATDMAEALSLRYPAFTNHRDSEFPNSRPIPTTCTDAGAHVACFAVHGIIHVGIMPAVGVMRSAMKQYLKDTRWYEDTWPRLVERRRDVVGQLAKRYHLTRLSKQAASSRLLASADVTVETARRLASAVQSLEFERGLHEHGTEVFS